MRYIRLVSLWLKRLLTRNTIVGDVDDRIFVHPLTLNDKRFGKSTRYPAALEIIIDKKGYKPIRAGKMADEIFFADLPRLWFNVCFSCGRPRFLGKGRYTDPRSHWFNVFFGYYQIDAACDEWDRPFGYKEFSAEHRVPEPTDFLRIGKSDWNYFSNYMYGVPPEAIHPYDSLKDPGLEVKIYSGLEAERIGGRYWDRVELSGFRVVSAYCSRGASDLAHNDPFFTPLWQASFGHPHPRPEFKENFFGVPMKAVFYLSSSRGKDVENKQEVWKTAMFGGTINLAWPELNSNSEEERKQLEQFNEDFLEAQLQSARDVIQKNYSDLGYSARI